MGIDEELDLSARKRELQASHHANRRIRGVRDAQEELHFSPIVLLAESGEVLKQAGSVAVQGDEDGHRRFTPGGAHWRRANEGTSITATAMNRQPSMAPAKKTSRRSCSMIVGQISLMTKARCSSAGRSDPTAGHWIGETIERAKKGMRLRVRFFPLASAELVRRALLSGTNAFALESSAREFGIDEDCWACECQTANQGSCRGSDSAASRPRPISPRSTRSPAIHYLVVSP